MIHRINVFLLSLLIVIAPIYASAGAAEAWTIQEVKYNDVGKNLTYTAKRANAIAANDYVYKANVGVTAARTGATAANMIRMGLAGAAIYGIVEGVGWIIENGVVKKPVESQNPKIYWSWIMPWDQSYKPGFSSDTRCNGINSTYSSAFSNFEYCTKKYDSAISVSCTSVSSTFYACNVYRSGSVTQTSIAKLTNPNGTDNIFVPVPDSELGEAINDSPQAPSVLPDIYNPNNPAGGPAPEATADALDNALPEPVGDPSSDTTKKPNKDTNGDGIPDTYDPNEPDAGETTTWPKACEWFPVICEWYVKYKEDSKKVDEHREKETEVWTKEEAHRTNEKEVWEEEKTHRTDEKTFWEKVEDWFDWTTNDPDLPEDDNEIEEIVPDIGTLDTGTFKATAGCPAPIQIPAYGNFSSFEISYEPICQFASKWSFVSPLIGFLSGAMIVIGVGRKGEDSDI